MQILKLGNFLFHRRAHSAGAGADGFLFQYFESADFGSIFDVRAAAKFPGKNLRRVRPKIAHRINFDFLKIFLFEKMQRSGFQSFFVRHFLHLNIKFFRNREIYQIFNFPNFFASKFSVKCKIKSRPLGSNVAPRLFYVLTQNLSQSRLQ